MAQVRNKATGQVLNIPDDQVAFMSSQWETVGSASNPSMPAQSPAPTPVQSRSVTIYDQRGNANTVPTTDLSYWQSQGWSTSKPSAVPTSSPSPVAVNPQGLTVQQMVAAGNGQVPTPQVPQPTSTPSTPSTQAVASPQDPTQLLQSMGINTAGLDQTQTQWLGMMAQAQQSLAANDKNIAPPSLSSADMANYLNQAKSFVDPQFQQQFAMGAQDAQAAIAQFTGDVSYQSQQTQQQQELDRKALADQMAEAGLTFSGIRQKATEQLGSSQTGLVRSQASQYQSKLADLAHQYQQQYGTDALRALNIPALQYAGVNIAPPTPYTMAPGTSTLETQQSVAEIGKQSELAQNALAQQTAAQQNMKLQPLASL